MKEKKHEEIKENKVEIIKTKKNENKFVTKERVISFTIGIFVGMLITFGITCLYMKMHYPKDIDNQKVQIHDRQRPNIQRKHNKLDKRQKKESITDNADESNTDNSSQNND